MTNPLSTLERAFELARSGDYLNTVEIRAQLKKERYDQVEAHLQGPAITRQLRLLCQQATSGKREPA